MNKLLNRVGLLGVASVPLDFVTYTTADAGTQFQLTSMLGPVVWLTMAAETSHTFGVWSAKTGVMPTETRLDSPLLSTKVWGKTFRNPIVGRLTTTDQPSCRKCTLWSCGRYAVASEQPGFSQTNVLASISKQLTWKDHKPAAALFHSIRTGHIFTPALNTQLWVVHF